MNKIKVGDKIVITRECEFLSFVGMRGTVVRIDERNDWPYKCRLEEDGCINSLHWFYAKEIRLESQQLELFQ